MSIPVIAAWVSRSPQSDIVKSRAALQLLQVCAFFGPEPISRKMFSGVRGTPVPEALAEAFADPIKLNRAVREISRYSLAKIDHRNNTLQLHRLVQTVFKNRLNTDEQDTMRHAVHVLLVNGDPDTADNWPRYAALLPHATMSRAANCRDKWVRELMINLVLYLLASGDYGGALDFAEQCISIWRENPARPTCTHWRCPAGTRSRLEGESIPVRRSAEAIRALTDENPLKFDVGM